MNNIEIGYSSGISNKINTAVEYIKDKTNKDVKLFKNLINSIKNDYNKNIAGELKDLERMIEILKNNLELLKMFENWQEIPDYDNGNVNKSKYLMEKFNKEFDRFHKLPRTKEFYDKFPVLSDCVRNNFAVVNGNLRYLTSIFYNDLSRNSISGEFLANVNLYINCFKRFEIIIGTSLKEMEFDSTFESFYNKRDCIYKTIGVSGFNQVIEQEKALFMEIFNLYLTGQSLIKMIRKYPTVLFEKSKLTVNSFSDIISYKFTEFFKLSLDSLKDQIKQRYSVIFKLIQLFQQIFNNKNQLNGLIQELSIWDRTSLSFKHKKLVFFKTRFDYFPTFSNLTHMNETVQDNINIYFEPIDTGLTNFQNEVNQYIVQLKISLSEVMEMFNVYKSQSKFSADFIK